MLTEAVGGMRLLALTMEEDHEPGVESHLQKLQKARKRILL